MEQSGQVEMMAPDFAFFTRVETYDADMGLFR